MADLLDDLYTEFGENICLSPFLEMFISTWAYGENKFTVLPCCVGTNNFNQEGYSAAGSSAIEVYNKDVFVNFRKTFLEGKGLENHFCGGCKKHESTGATSVRKAHNHHIIDMMGQEAIDIVRRVKENDCKVQLGDIAALIYMPSNFCNQACIMCNPGASSKRKEHMRRMGDTFDNNHLETGLDPSDLDDILKSLKLINFTGGETLIQPQVLKSLDTMISSGTAKNSSISILTNLSKYNKSLMSKLELFENCYMTCSIDGVGKIVEYQRIGCKWSEMAKNMIDMVTNHPKIGYVINYVVTAVSAISIPDMIKWCRENNLAKGDNESDQRFLIFTPVRDVNYLEISVLPSDVVNDILNQLRQLQQFEWPGYQTMITDAISYLSSHKHNPELKEVFKSIMALEDAARNDGLTYRNVMGNILD